MAELKDGHELLRPPIRAVQGAHRCGRRSRLGGFGIGAFEARELIRSMGGRVDVESREGLGTRFTISLPIQAASSLIRRSNSADNNEVA